MRPARSRGAAPGPRRTRPTSGPFSGLSARRRPLGSALAVDLGDRVERLPLRGLSRAASTPAAVSRLVLIAAAEVSSLACARCFRAAVASLPTSPVTQGVGRLGGPPVAGPGRSPRPWHPSGPATRRTSRTRSCAGVPDAARPSPGPCAASAATFAAVSSAASKSPSPKTSFARPPRRLPLGLVGQVLLPQLHVVAEVVERRVRERPGVPVEGAVGLLGEGQDQQVADLRLQALPLRQVHPLPQLLHRRHGHLLGGDLLVEVGLPGASPARSTARPCAPGRAGWPPA